MLSYGTATWRSQSWREHSEYLTTPAELGGILNFELEGLKRVRANDWHFSYGEKESGELYRRESNPIVAFLEDM